MHYVSYLDAKIAAQTMRQITGLTYVPQQEKAGGYNLFINLSYPVAARDKSTVYLTRSIVPGKEFESSQKPAGQRSHEQFAQTQQNISARNQNVTAKTISPENYGLNSAALGRVQSLVGNGNNNIDPSGLPGAVPGQNLTPQLPPLPVGRTANAVAAPQFQAGTGKSNASNDSIYPNQKQINFYAGAGDIKSTRPYIPGAGNNPGNSTNHSGNSVDGNVSSLSSSIGLIIDQYAG